MCRFVRYYSRFSFCFSLNQKYANFDLTQYDRRREREIPWSYVWNDLVQTFKDGFVEAKADKNMGGLWLTRKDMEREKDEEYQRQLVEYNKLKQQREEEYQRQLREYYEARSKPEAKE